jgi:hypothetical protein
MSSIDAKGKEVMTKSNVNPDHYKTAGRERQGEDIVQEIQKQKFAQEEAAHAGRQPGNTNFIPSAAPVGESPSDANNEAARGGEETVGQVNEAANSSSTN